MIKDFAELVRAPAAITVPGDTMAGGSPTAVLAVSSVCLYWAGMALNDYADRDLDAKERPERPIPSGRVRPGRALAVALALTGSGLGLTAATGGLRALRVALPLAGAVYAYDLSLKDTHAGPAVMAVARGLDVLLGGAVAAEGVCRALPAAAAIAAHTYGVTTLSRGEVNGGTAPRSSVALVATGLATSLAGCAILRGARAGYGTAEATLLLAVYAGFVGRAQVRATRRSDAAVTRQAVGASILGLMPLQAALIAGRGRPLTAAALAAACPLARRLFRKISPT